jgi:hypothetical protein
MSTPEGFTPIPKAARLLGLPVGWLQAEADAGRIPSLPVGRRALVNVPAVEKALLDRTLQAAPANAGGQDGQNQ